ncbi:hypothetical protein [Brevundimonas sp. M20]|uniref:hypothetical protein n=1 Tax=Brevundimonas sp. M20 TaxID=2591463 RepID=UPI001146958B|nr:hypothetical protein [Brevundimonas sp. M20]QDH72915.1 hypothetical protein FKQ52_05475 [Brevundimonas sp. M20]
MAALTLHVIVLLPIALSTPSTPTAPIREPVYLIPLDLTETLSRRTATRRSPLPAARPAPDHSTAPPSAPRPRAPATTGARPPSGSVEPLAPPPAEQNPAQGQAMDDPWRGRRPAPAGLPCPAPPGDRIGARLCLVGPTPDRDREPEAYADAGTPRRSRAEQSREDGFERQRQANEAWRDYTRGEGAYPGLRSLFTER